MKDIITLTTSITTSATQYAAGDNVGGLIKFKGSQLFQDGVGYIQTAILTDLAKQDAEADLFIFNSKPDSTTFTDNAALDIHDNDITKIIGIVTFDCYHDLVDNSVAGEGQLSIPFKIDSSEIYGAIVTRGTPTYAAGTDLNIRLGGYRL